MTSEQRLIALVVLATANHYVLDVVAGAALWFIVDQLTLVVYGPLGHPTSGPAVGVAAR